MDSQDKRKNREHDSQWWHGGLKQALALPASVRIVGWTAPPGVDVARELVAGLPVAALPPALSRASPKRQNEYLAGRYCAMLALKAAGCDVSVPPGMGQDRLPQWPPGWRGCITHSNGQAVAAVSHIDASRLLGIDVEKLIDPVSVAGIGALVALEGELALFAGLSLSQALTLLFSAKESLYKALYPEVRRFMNFSAAKAIAFAPGRLDLLLAEDWHSAWPAGSVLPIRYALRGDCVYTALHLPR